MKKITLLLFLLISSISFGQVIITELADPNNSATAANTRYVEIYNISGGDVDLTGWELRRWTNGNAATTSQVDLTPLGTLSAGGFAVIAANAAAFQTAYGVAADLEGGTAGPVDSNGDDQIGLFNNSDTLVDIFGVPGEDGSGTCHEFEDGRAERKATVTAANTTWDESEWNVWADDTVSGCTSHTNAAQDAPGNFDPGAWIGASADPSLNASVSASTFAPGTTSVAVSFSTNNFDLTGDNVVEYIVNGGTPATTTSSPINVTVTDGESYTVTLELKNAGGALSPEVKETVNFSVASITNVANIGALRAGTEGDYYMLTGEALLTYAQSFRSQKYIQDATAAILIDDNDGIITTSYNVGDGITGIKGQLTSFNSLLQFVPIEDPGAASTTGNTITPEEVTLADLAANPVNYESELISVIEVTVDTSVNTDWTNGAEYTLTQNSDTFTFRASFFDVDYIGTAINTDPQNIVGLVTGRNTNLFLTARNAADITDFLSTDSFTRNGNAIYMFPNPSSTGVLNFTTGNENVDIKVFNILGKQVLASTVNNSSVNTADLAAGIYLVQFSQEGKKIATKKLVIR
ncbi:lamin tail domain-containing protein [Aquimarina rhabdastrellae]